MRAIWTGSITFGLVNVPVKLYSATEDHDIDLHQVHAADGGRIRYQRRCEVCGKVIPYDKIDRAFVEDDETVILTKDDFATLPQERNREIEVVEFVPASQVDPILFDRSYYLEPTGKSIKAYTLLRRTLEKTDRTATARFALRQKTRLAALRVRGKVLTVQTMLWADEVREAEFPSLDESVRISTKELQLSAALVKSYSSDFTPEAFTDDYQVELRKLIEQKRQSGEALEVETPDDEADRDAEVIDLMAALRESVKKARSTKSKSTKSKPMKSKSTKARRSGTMKSPARKSTPKSAKSTTTASKSNGSSKKAQRKAG